MNHTVKALPSPLFIIKNKTINYLNFNVLCYYLFNIFRLVINDNNDISKLFGEMTFNNNGRKLVNDQNTYDTDYSDDSSDDETLFDNGNK